MTPTQWRYGLMRFGIASGRCLGKNMADLILKMVAAGAVEAFELVKVEATSPGEGKGTEMRGLVGEVEFRKR
jgi:cytochrome P450